MPPLRSPWTLPTHTLTQHKQATTRQALDRLGKIHAPLAATLLQQPLHPQRPASPQGGYWVPGGKGRGPRTTTRPRSNKPTGGHDVRFSRRRGPEPVYDNAINMPPGGPHSHRHPFERTIARRMLNNMPD
eukprot:1179951-Prorocentrum_minimum.AAC.2